MRGATTAGAIDRAHLRSRLADGEHRFTDAHPRSPALFARARSSLQGGVHNMALIAPTATEADVDLHTLVFRESVEGLLA